MSCDIIDSRGYKILIYVEKDKVFSATLTFVDSNGDDLVLGDFDDIILRVETDTPTEYSLDNGDMSIANVNELTIDILVSIAVGEYNYSLNMETSTGEIQYMYGKFKVT